MSLSLAACAVQGGGEEDPLADQLNDGKTDSLNKPTDFGRLYNQTWQYGELDPEKKERTLAWRFDLSAAAAVTVTTRVAPTEEPDLANTVAYIYKKQSGSTWKLQGKSTEDDFGTLTAELPEGAYRVIVKGRTKTDSGRFMLRLDCEGDGCPQDESLLDGRPEDLASREHGALVKVTAGETTAASMIGNKRKAQLIAAIALESGNEVSTFEEALALVDGGTAQRYNFFDTLSGRSFAAFEFTIDGRSTGVWFMNDGLTPVGHITDGETDKRGDEGAPRTCVFGQKKGDTTYMPDMREVSSTQVKKASDITSNTLRAQLLDSVSWEGLEQEPTIDDLFEGIDDSGFTVTTYKTEGQGDARTFISIDYYSGDTPVGAFYTSRSARRLAAISDGEIDNCSAWY